MGIKKLLSNNNVDIAKALNATKYDIRLKKLQEQLIDLQERVIKKNEKVVILFEGRDSAGKGGAIRRIASRINPRHFRIIALPKPTEEEQGQWYFQRYINHFPKPNAVINPDQILKAREVVREVYMDEKIEQYIVDIVGATRNPKENGLEELESLIEFGGSPRASINLALAAKAYAFINHRGYVIPEDVREICKDVLRHRIGLSYEAEAENITVSQIIDTILNKVQVP
ncbi:hypothetical protein OAD28_07550 [Flavobacteriales bacterium]|nr:hypothetical protein [Flavobacteriales bacterium]